MTTLGMILVIVGLAALLISLFEGSPWQAAVSVVAVLIVAYYACGYYWWKVFDISPGRGALLAAGILIASMIWAIYTAASNAETIENIPDETTPAINENEDRSNQCQGCHLAHECRGGDPKTCQTSK